MTEIKNMAYWKAKNVLPGINSDFEKGNNLPDGRSGSSPLQDNGKAVKASDVSVEDQIAKANKMFGGKGVTVAPKTKTDPTGSGKQTQGIDALANTAMHNMMAGSSYKGHNTFQTLPFSEKQVLRNKALDYQKKMQKIKKSKPTT
tara:strand:- start:1050 stop:1484 length:435 start_codon:yes stop_codon:yes gene_type:complete